MRRQQEAFVLSVIMRAHEGAPLALLDEALFSVAMAHRELADGCPLLIERVLVTQVGQIGVPGGDAQELQALLDAHARSDDPPAQLLVLHNPERYDLRSHALNCGKAAASGRYLAFLDYDDVVYPGGYAMLIDRLRSSGAVLAAGGAVRAQVEPGDQGLYVNRKQPWLHLGTQQGDLLDNNFLPLHSFVIDQAQCKLSRPWFDESLSRLEDYDFLLRLAATAPFDLSLLDTYVCEYRLVARHSQSADGVGADFAPTNVNPLSNRESTNLAAWARAKRHVAALKRQLEGDVRAQAAQALPRAGRRLGAARVGERAPSDRIAFFRALGIAIDQSGGAFAFVRRVFQLARDIGVSGVLRRAQQIVRRM